MSIHSAWQEVFDFLGGTPIVVEPSAAQITSDAGLLPVRQFDERIGLTRQFAEALDDPRDPELIDHTFLEMVRSRTAILKHEEVPRQGITLEMCGDDGCQSVEALAAVHGIDAHPDAAGQAQGQHDAILKAATN